MRALSVRRLDSELAQVGFLHRQRVTPAVVVPFFFIGPVHAGHRGRLVVTGKVNQTDVYHRSEEMRGLNEKVVVIMFATLLPAIL